MKKIPENPTERHPVMLLNQLRPGTLYVEQSRSGVAPNITFIMGCTVDGKEYIGTGKTLANIYSCIHIIIPYFI